MNRPTTKTFAAPSPSSYIRRELGEAIDNAKKICKEEGDMSAQCRVAWDAVSDISTGFYKRCEEEHKNAADPLDLFCEEYPEADECRIYEV
jgi:hypothetical protein